MAGVSNVRLITIKHKILLNMGDMKLKIKALAIAGIIGLSSLVVSTGVSAEPVAEYDTKVNIFFQENTDVTLPVDPTNPDKDVTPDKDIEGNDVIEEGTPGPLSIDYASHINFGTVKKSGSAQTYYAKPITFTEAEVEKAAPYVQVTDNRGTLSGWKLTVSQATQFTADSAAILKGAELSLENGEVKSNSSSVGVTHTNVIFKNLNEAYPVLTAAADSGAGTFTDQFGKIMGGEATDVSLSIPGELAIEDGKYSTTLNWSLEDTP